MAEKTNEENPVKEVPSRGFKMEATVVSDKMHKSAVVERLFNRKIPKYHRVEKRKTRLTVHNPEHINAKVGDIVLIQECRPLSKTKNFIIVQKLEKGLEAAVKIVEKEEKMPAKGKKEKKNIEKAKTKEKAEKQPAEEVEEQAPEEKKSEENE